MEGQRDIRGTTEVVARREGRSATEVEACPGGRHVTNGAVAVVGGGVVLAARMDSDGEAPTFCYVIMVAGGGMINKI